MAPDDEDDLVILVLERYEKSDIYIENVTFHLSAMNEFCWQGVPGDFMIMKYNAKSLHSIALKYIKRRVYCTLCLQRRHCIWDCFCVHPSQEKAITHRSWQYKADDMIGRESKNLSLGRLVGKLPSLYRGCPYCLIRFYHSSIPGENCMTDASFSALIWQIHMQDAIASRELMFIA